MPLVSISDDLDDLLDRNDHIVKGKYITRKLFADSAIREKLRREGVAGVGDDEIIGHLKKLEQSKSRRLDKQAIVTARRNQERRVKRAESRLNKQGD